MRKVLRLSLFICLTSYAGAQNIVLTTDQGEVSEFLIRNISSINFEPGFVNFNFQNTPAESFRVAEITNIVFSQTNDGSDDGDENEEDQPEDSVITSTFLTNGDYEFFIYPNPANNKIFISKETGLLKNFEVEILTSKGQQLELSPETVKTNGEGLTIDLESLLPGLYFLKISDNLSTRTLRFYKE